MENTDLEALEDLAIIEEELEIVDEEEIEAPIKVKKPRTQKQIDAFAKVLALREENRNKRRDEKNIKELENEKILQKKILQKAIAIKKKSIRESKILEIKDDEIIELPRKLVKIDEKPKIIFKFL